MRRNRFWIVALVLALVLILAVGLGVRFTRRAAYAQGVMFQAQVGTGFTYQGRLTDGGGPVDGEYDFRFMLYDAASDGAQVGSTVTKEDVTVIDGLFTVQLDFGSGAFTGEARYLEIGVRQGSSTGGYTDLAPRQPLTPAPYALAMPGLWTQQNGTSPNLIGGYSGNSVGIGVVGATIGGGGNSGLLNQATGSYATIGGGWGQTAIAPYTTIGGGWSNTAGGDAATVCGGHDNVASDVETTVGGGYGNTASGYAATIGGGYGNGAIHEYATICGGWNNIASFGAATIGGGNSNQATNWDATVGGGLYNTASGPRATVGGGRLNTAGGFYATIGGGDENTAGGDYVTIGGGHSNTAGGESATVSGGEYNTTDGNYVTIGGGYLNAASAPTVTVGGGEYISVTGKAATVAGGSWITATGDYAAVGGGLYNTASGDRATVGGGRLNTASYRSATVGGGHSNEATGDSATISGGEGNTASGDFATIGGGEGNAASEHDATVSGGGSNTASDQFATVPGGHNNTAQGRYSFAAGQRAKANHDGAFVWSDSSDFDFASTASDQFSARATGGFRFVLGIDGSGNPTWTCSVADGGSWSCSSDRNLKENFVPVDGSDVLEHLSQMPIYYWNAKGQTTPHIGPTAQDFYAAFGVGGSDTSIATIDLDGVALAAIQGLYEQNVSLQAKSVALEAEVSSYREETGVQQGQIRAMQQQNADLEARVTALEAALANGSTPSQVWRTNLLPWAGFLLVGSGVAWMFRRRDILGSFNGGGR